MTFSFCVLKNNFQKEKSRKGIGFWYYHIQARPDDRNTTSYRNFSVYLKYQRRIGSETVIVPRVDFLAGLSIVKRDENDVWNTGLPAKLFNKNLLLGIGYSTMIPVSDRYGFHLRATYLFFIGKEIERYPYTSGILFSAGIDLNNP